MSLEQGATPTGTTACDYCDSETYCSARGPQHNGKAQTRNKQRKCVCGTADERRRMELHKLQIWGNSEGLVKLKNQEKMG